MGSKERRIEFHNGGGRASLRSVFGLNSKELEEHLSSSGWSPTPIQSASVETLSKGNDGLLVAATGSGKTMAAVLPLLDRCLKEGWQGLSILYITPLRALNRDVDRRLHNIASSVGLSVGLRHGDTTQSDRQKQVRNPPTVLVTTPETFQVMFSGHRLVSMLQNVKAVVIDEVHDLSASERGWQLSLGLARLERLSGTKVQKVGLSATVGNPTKVAEWISPQCVPIVVEGDRRTEIEVQSAQSDALDEAAGFELGLSPRAHASLRILGDRISEKSPCLVFVNSRNAAETVAQRLQTISPHLRIGVHHGSLASETRRAMEDDLRKRELNALICTSSLELGIDVGSIAHVIQMRSPRSVDRMLQRVGRAEHHLEGVGRGRVISWEADDIAESAVIARRALQGDIEDIEWRRRPYSVVANQLVQMARCWGVVAIDEATSIIAEAHQFEDWSREDTIEVARILEDNWLLNLSEQAEQRPWWTWNKVLWQESLLLCKDRNLPDEPPRPAKGETSAPIGFEELKMPIPARYSKGWFSGGSRTWEYARNHLSMIPDNQSYRVRDAVTRRSLGSVDEAFVLSLDSGGDDEDGRRRHFVMAGRTWQVIDADPEQEELLVSPISDQGTAPVWSGELPPTPAAVAREVGRLRHMLAADVDAVEPSEDEFDQYATFCRESLDVSDYPLDDVSRALLLENVLSHLDSAGTLPTDRCITIESREEAIVVNSCHGNRINEAIAHLLQALASMKSGKMGRILVEATRITLQMGGLSSEEVLQWLNDTPPDAVEGILSVTLPNSRQVRWRFAEVAKVFGILRKGVDPRKINLRALLRRYKGTVVMQEVLGRLFHERMDVEGAADLLRSIQSGQTDVRITPPGTLGISAKGERDLLMPNWSNVQVRERLESRLMNERAVLCCLRCRTIKSFRVARFERLELSCASCRGSMFACAREGLKDLLEKTVASKEKADIDRMNRCAEAIKRRGIEAVLCLMGRGIGETTTTRLLRSVAPGDRQGLLESIHLAEVNYARTRRFW